MNGVRSTEPEERPIESAPDPAPDVAVIEFRTYIQDRSVSCRWSNGRVTGDAELLRRVQRSAGSSDWRRSPTSVADALTAAVACPVLMHVVQAPVVGPRARSAGGSKPRIP